MKNTFLKIAIATILCATLWSCEKVTKTDDGWVDLGLPSGLLWASCNVGADKPQDYGDYFAWGETVSKTSFTKDNYNCRDIYNGSNNWATTLLPSDDAATVNMGDNARIPTKEEWDELLTYCEIKGTVINKVRGIKFTSKNGNSIFLPAAGYKNGNESIKKDSQGIYLSSSQKITEITNEVSSIYYIFSTDESSINSFVQRYYGMSVRAVCKGNND